MYQNTGFQKKFLKDFQKKSNFLHKYLWISII